jgi:sec-independent protein translocase protein TatA
MRSAARRGPAQEGRVFGVGTQELLVILLVVLLLFGGKRIPEVARSLGSGLRDLRRAMQDVQREVNAESLEPRASLPPPYGERKESETPKNGEGQTTPPPEGGGAP